jgi:RNA polymerase sigma factor for flagellar operon FliA
MSGVSAYSQRPSARDTEALVMRHAELVKRIAYHLAGRLPTSVEVDDLIQAGMLGLLEAAANYSAGRGASFETYAGIRIRGAMLDGLRKLDWAPRSVHRKARAVANAIRELEAEIGREARDTDVATKMGVSLEEYHKIVEDAAGCQISSLTTEEGEINATDPDADPFRDVIDERFRAALTDAIAGARAHGDVPVLRRRAEPEGNRRGAQGERIAHLPDPRPGADAVAGAARGLARQTLIGERS